MNTETDFLRDLAHCFVTAGPSRTIPSTVSWPALHELLVQHGVMTTLADCLLRPDLPPAAQAEVAAAISQAEHRNTVMLLELTRILARLEPAECHPVVLKGAVLAQSVYRAPYQRLFADLDLLVPAALVTRTCEILTDLGYTANESNAPVAYYDKYHFHRVMRNAHGITVEVHWSLTDPHSCYQYDLDRFFARTQMLATPNGPLRIPHWHDQLLHGVFQNIADGFSSLRRVIDAALVLPLIEDQAALAAEAHEQNLATGLWAVLQLVSEFTGTIVPSRLTERLTPPASIIRSFEMLDLPRLCLTRETTVRPGTDQLLHWLCTPNGAVARREIRRYLLPGAGGYFYYQHDRGRPPGLSRRLKLTLEHLVFVVQSRDHLAGILRRGGRG